MKYSTAKNLLELGAEVAGAALDGRAPDPGSVAQRLVSLGLDLVNPEDLRGYLDAEARRRVDAEIDAEIASRFGREG